MTGAGIRWWNRLRFVVRNRARRIVIVLVLTVGAGLLVLAAWRDSRQDGSFLGELYLEVGAGLAITLSTYVVLNPLFKELRAARIAEHPRLDRDALIANVRRCRHTVAILETWTDMLEGNYRKTFLEALRAALTEQATVRILLLDPDSPGVSLRRHELRDKRDVQQAILANLRHLAGLRRELGDELRARLQVRTYIASPSVQMYRWDNKAYISFFPLDQSNFDVPQIETYMSTPLGEFVQRRFDELWNAQTTRELDQLLHLRVRARHPDRDLEPCEVRFVVMDEVYFVTSSTLTRQISKYGIGALNASLGNEHGVIEYRMVEADDFDTVYHQRVLDLFAAKYDINTNAEDEPFIVALLRPE